MGAAVTLELAKPPDASDIREIGSLSAALSEVVRLRRQLGMLAAEYDARSGGNGEGQLSALRSNLLVVDGSDLVGGASEEEAFERCVQEVAHIRQCLRLHTQSSRRRQRCYDSSAGAAAALEEKHVDDDCGSSSSSNSSSSDNEADAADGV